MEDEIKRAIRVLKNMKAKEWRDKNKDKVKEAEKRYWEKKAREYLAKEKEK